MNKALTFLAVGSVAAMSGLFISQSGITSAHLQGQGGLGFGGENREAVQAALEANDYSALPTEAQEKIDESQFAQMVERHAQHEQVEAAIEAGDYDVFLAVANERALERVTNEDDFNELVARHQSQQEHRAAIESAVVANDFTAFQAAIEAHHAEMEAHRPEDAPQRPEISDEEKVAHQQEMFDNMVAVYEETGELPAPRGPGKGHGKIGGPGGSHGGERGMNQ